jgi:regulator of protease activity HflC (stomatin/prohibitin superfamily)
MILIWIILALVAFALISGIRVVDQYERGIVLTLGKFSRITNPGLTWIFSLLEIQRMLKVDIRIKTVDIPQQEVITKDNVTVGINAVVYFRVVDPSKAVLEVENYVRATSNYAQSALRDVIGGVELDTLLSERDKIAQDIRNVIDVAITGWGIDVTAVKMQDIELPADMKRAMAKQAEAERERRAVIITAQGELSASENLKAAAVNLSSVPGGLSLRTLKTVEAINPDPSKTVLFVLPVELLDAFKKIAGKGE